MRYGARVLTLGFLAATILGWGIPRSAWGKEPWDFETDKAREAKAKYDEAVKEAREEYRARVRELREQLVADLEVALKHAMTVEQDLDEAIRIRDAKRLIEKAVEEDTEPGVFLGTARVAAAGGWRYQRYDRFHTAVNPSENAEQRDLAKGLELIRTFKGNQMRTADLDGDGALEAVLGDQESLTAVDCEGEELWRVKFDKRFSLGFVEDIDPSAGQEIIGSCRVDRGDAEVVVVSSQGKMLKRITLQVNQEGLSPQCAADLDADGRLEIIASMGSGYGHHRRGVWVFEYPSGDEKWHFEIGPSPSAILVDDFNGDGKKEIVLGMGSPHNGNRANGYSDLAGSWMLCLSHDGKVLWDAKLGTWGLYPVAADIDGDGELEAVVYRNQDYYGGNASVYTLGLKEGNVIDRYDGRANDSCWPGVVGDLDGDGKVEVFGTFGVKERCLRSLDETMKEAGTVDQVEVARAAGDLGGDAGLELVTTDYKGSRFYVRDPDLDLLWSGKVPEGRAVDALITDIDADGFNELVVRGEGQFFVYKTRE